MSEEQDYHNAYEARAKAKTVNLKAVLDPTQIYLAKIGNFRLLSSKQEITLAHLIKKGDKKAYQFMVESNLRLVVKVARYYCDRGLSFLDLIEEGNLGLMHAAYKFDPDRGFRFSTYATWWIRQTVERALMNQGRTVRLPVHVIKEMNRYLRISRDLIKELDHEPKISEIAKAANKSSKKIGSVLNLKKQIASLEDNVTKDSESSFLEMLSDDVDYEPASLLENEELYKVINLWVETLSPDESNIVVKRFGLHGYKPETLEKISKEMGLTRERIRKSQIKSLFVLKDMLIKKGILDNRVD